jgi:MraZ protein
MGFNGYFEHSLDAKHRLSLPARFRTHYSSGLVLSQDPDACISVWPPELHQATVAQALEGKNPLTSEYKKLQRYFHGHSFDLELDSAGRVTLPPPLRTHARVDKEVGSGRPPRDLGPGALAGGAAGSGRGHRGGDRGAWPFFLT